MEDKKIGRIIIRQSIKSGITKLRGYFKPVNIIGLDTETVNGQLYTVQLDSDSIHLFRVMEGKSEEELLDWFFDQVPKGTTQIFAHNLEFDLGVMFPYIARDCPKEKYGYTMRVIYSHPTFMSVSCKTRQKSIQFIDTLMFFLGSLESQAERLHLPVKKMEHPPSLMENRKPRVDEMEYFREYAMNDARIAYFLGKEIVKMHQEHDVPARNTVSPATLASKIYRSSLKKNIPYQPKFINLLALRSYHGGRTEAFGYGTIGCRVYDFNSAYPYAMTQIPVPSEKEWKKTDKFDGVNGFYKISGELPMKKVSPLPYKNSRLLFPVGRFKDFFVTGYEAEQIVFAGRIDKIKGWVYTGETDDSIKDYVLDFYTKKNASKADPVAYHFNKLMMNSIYGKYLQLNPAETFNFIKYKFAYNIRRNELVELRNNNTHLLASGMFNPVIASWITGFTRAMLYQKLNKYEDDVLYCDTDSVITRKGCSIPSSDRLGDLKFEKEGDATILREKLYMIRKNNEIVKTAQHGFWGNQDELFKLIVRGDTHYKIARMTKLREAYIQKKSPFMFETQDRIIDLSPSMKRSVPASIKSFNFLENYVPLDPIVLNKPS